MLKLKLNKKVVTVVPRFDPSIIINPFRKDIYCALINARVMIVIALED